MMTQEEFSKTTFHAGQQMKYSGQLYPLKGVNFKEALLAYNDGDEESEYTWVRCENVEILSK